MEAMIGPPNRFLSALSAHDCELIRANLRTVEMSQEAVLVANTLQQANFIHYSRGHIEITDLDGLGKTSCECYATVKAQYERLIHPGARREH